MGTRAAIRSNQQSESLWYMPRAHKNIEALGYTQF